MSAKKVWLVYADGEKVGTHSTYDSAILAAESRMEARRPVSFSVDGRMTTRYYPRHKTVFLRSSIGGRES